MATHKSNSNNDYERGKRWGHAIFKSNLELYGKDGVHKSDKAHTTCRNYERNKNLTRTRSGKRLDSRTRSAYRGIADGLLEAFEKWQNAGSRNSIKR